MLDIRPAQQSGKYELAGELDLSTVEELREVLERERQAGHAITLDLSNLTFMDSQGLRLILTFTDAHGPPLTLLAPSRPVRRLLDLALPGEVPGLEVRQEGDTS